MKTFIALTAIRLRRNSREIDLHAEAITDGSAPENLSKDQQIVLHSEAMTSDGLDAATLVREVLEEARRTVGSGSAFAQRLEELGVGPETGRYSQSAVSNWIKGRTMPPADVVLAAAYLAGISLDRRLLPADQATQESAGWRKAADDLQSQIDALQAQMIEICGRLGIPVPRVETQPATKTRRVENG